MFGHIHSSPYKFDGTDAGRSQSNLTPTQYDVGVDWNRFKPISYEKLIMKLELQVYNNVNMYDRTMRIDSCRDTIRSNSV